jgi:raffinose synthase
LKNGQVWRNSEDYQPRADMAGQQKHVHHNAMNSFWSSQFALPDWDGFQSHGPCAEFHAAARAISGGPVYVTDEPGKQDFDLLRRLIDSRGRLLQCDRPALPTRDCLLVDCGCDEQLLKVSNVCGKAGVLGLFHVRQQDARITSAFQASDVPELKEDEYLAWFTRQKKAVVVTREEWLTQELDRADYEIVTFTPFVNEMAAIGLIDTFVPAAGIDEVIPVDGELRVRLQDGGTFGLYARQLPCSITMRGEDLPFAEDDGLIRIEVPAGRSVEIEVRL